MDDGEIVQESEAEDSGSVGEKIPQYPAGVNVYKFIAGRPELELQLVKKLLDRAMEETGVLPEAMPKIGDVVLRMAKLAQNNEVVIDTSGMPGMEAVCDTYDRFIELTKTELPGG